MPNPNDGILVMDITYPMNEPAKFKIEGNVKPEKHADLIADFLQMQVGKGKDPSKANEVDIYHIRIEIDLTEDTFKSSSNTGNLGLRDGILMDILGRLPEEK